MSKSTFAESTWSMGTESKGEWKHSKLPFMMEHQDLDIE